MRETAYRQHYEVEDHHWWFRGRRAVVRSLIERSSLPDRPRILDAGCGTGANLERYLRMGDAIGVDPSPEAVRFCRERGLTTVEQAGIEALPFGNERFDLLTATDVLEHVPDEGAALRELHRVAAPNAILLLTVPAYMWLWSDEDEKLQHCRRYTRPRLRRALEEHGWQPQIATYFNLLLLPAIAAVRLFSRGRKRRGAEVDATPARLDGPLSLPMRLEARLIRAGVDLPAGVSIGVVSRRHR